MARFAYTVALVSFVWLLLGDARAQERGALSLLVPDSPIANPPALASAISPDGNFLHVATGTSIESYSVTAGSGALTVSPTTAVTVAGPADMVITPNGVFLYVTNGANPVEAFTRDLATGVLTAATDSNAGTPTALAATPNSMFLIVGTAANVQAYSITAATAALTAVGAPVATAASVADIVVSPDGLHVYAIGGANIFQYSIDAAGNILALTPSSVTLASTGNALVISTTGVDLYAALSGVAGGYQMFNRAPATGLLAVGTSVATGNQAIDVVLSPDNSLVYLINDNADPATDSVSQFTRDLTNGVLTAVNPATATTGTNPIGGHVSSNGMFLFVVNGAADNDISRFSISLASVSASTSVSASASASLASASVSQSVSQSVSVSESGSVSASTSINASVSSSIAPSSSTNPEVSETPSASQDPPNSICITCRAGCLRSRKLAAVCSSVLSGTFSVVGTRGCCIAGAAGFPANFSYLFKARGDCSVFKKRKLRNFCSAASGTLSCVSSINVVGIEVARFTCSR